MPARPGWTREEIYYLSERGYRLYREGRLREAAMVFEGLAAIEAENAYCRKALAVIFAGLDQHRTAVHHLSAILAREPLDAGALAGRCEALIALRDLAAARRDLDYLSKLPGIVDDVRRLRLQLLHELDRANETGAPQLPPGPPR